MTYLYQKINQSAFIDEFARYDREKDYSYDAKCALFDYYSELADETGEPIEVDVIDICGDWSEFESLDELNKATENDYESVEDIDDFTVIQLDNGNLLAAYY